MRYRKPSTGSSAGSTRTPSSGGEAGLSEGQAICAAWMWGRLSSLPKKAWSQAGRQLIADSPLARKASRAAAKENKRGMIPEGLRIVSTTSPIFTLVPMRWLCFTRFTFSRGTFSGAGLWLSVKTHYDLSI
ncbi:MAG: hypothetical protein ABFD97_25055 [Syntrophobacter sp.]